MVHKYLELWHGPEHIHPNTATAMIQEDPEFQRYEDKLLIYVALTLMIRYVAFYKNDPLQYEFIALEKRLVVPFITPKGHQVHLDGIIDALVEHKSTGRLMIWDHKTDSRGMWTKEVVALDRQLNQYICMLYLMECAPSMLTVNQISTSKSVPKSIANCPIEELFARHTIEVKPSRMEAWLQQIGHRIDQILEAAYIHKNLGSHCINCPFRQVCSMELDGIDPSAYLAMMPARNSKELKITIDIEDGAFDEPTPISSVN